MYNYTYASMYAGIYIVFLRAHLLVESGALQVFEGLMSL